MTQKKGRTTIYTTKRTVVTRGHSRPRSKPKPSYEAHNSSSGDGDGCGALIGVLILFFLIGSCTSCLGMSAAGGAASVSGQGYDTDGVDTTIATTFEIVPIAVVNDLAITLWIDKSYSIADGSVPKVTMEEVLPLVDLVDQVNGTIAVGVIGVHSKAKMIFYTHVAKSSLTPPKREHGMSSADYRKELMKYMERKKRASSPVDYASRRRAFERELARLLDYSRLEGGSEICEAIRVSKRLFAQSDNVEASKYLLMITDGAANGDEPCPFRVGSETEMIVVNRLSYNAFPMYKTERFVSVEAAVRHIVGKS